MAIKDNGRGAGYAPAAERKTHRQYTASAPDIRRASELFRQGFVFRDDGRVVRHSRFIEILPGPDGWATAIGVGDYRYEARVFWLLVMDQGAARV